MSAEGQKLRPGRSDAAQQRRFERTNDRDRTLAAMHQLEAALAVAAARREQAWSNEVSRTLGILSGLARKFAGGGHAARAWWSLSSWASIRCSRSSRSVRVNFQLNGLAMAL
jgi:hypothetical protein